jgi:hypothetical protein
VVTMKKLPSGMRHCVVWEAHDDGHNQEVCSLLRALNSSRSQCILGTFYETK